MSSGKQDIWRAMLDTGRFVFTTREIASLAGLSISAAVQTLARLEEAGIVKKVLRGVWAATRDRRFTPLALVGFLDAGRQTYVSFLSAMHLHGMIGQIPQVITVASTGHGRRVTTPVGAFITHQVDPGFFDGFVWSASGDFLIATPEKALLDCLYIASRRGKRYAHFPEIEFPQNFSKKRARGWLGRIKNTKLRSSVAQKLERILASR